MNDQPSDRNRFAAWEDAVADAVAFAEKFPLEVRSGIVQALLRSSESAETTASPTPPTPGNGAVSSGREQGGIASVARDAGVEVDTLSRFIQVGEDGNVTVRARLGTKRAESQNAYSTVLAYVREKALSALDTESPLIRAICKEHRCMDGNLAANLRKRGWLLEHGAKGGNKSYRLSPTGEDAAKELIVSLCGAD